MIFHTVQVLQQRNQEIRQFEGDPAKRDPVKVLKEPNKQVRYQCMKRRDSEFLKLRFIFISS